MKYILLLSLLLLTSCGSGYEVRGPYENRVGNQDIVYYACVYSRPFLYFNITLRQCPTQVECNDFCEKKRTEDK